MDDIPNIGVELFDEITEKFAWLFAGRTDAYGSWSGGCVRDRVTIETYERHLAGIEPIGIYPLTDDGMVKWGCSDIDINDLDLARNLELSFQVQGVRASIEQTDRGFHVWVFADEWVSAQTMRHAFLAAHEACGLPPKEVNPKQETAVKLGNYVRLPYPGWKTSQNPRRVMLNHKDEPIGLNDWFQSGGFSSGSIITRVAKLEAVAKLYTPPTVHSVGTINVPTVNVQDALKNASGYTVRMWREGPLQGSDRSNTLCRLAYRLQEEGVSATDAYVIVKDADERWGKFFERADTEEQLTRIINQAYGKV